MILCPDRNIYRGIHICMRDFHQFLQNKTEAFFGLFGSKGWSPPEPIDPKFEKYWKQLVLKHKGNPDEAWKEFAVLKSTPAGQHQMMRVNMQVDPRANAEIGVSPLHFTHPSKPTTIDDLRKNQKRADDFMRNPDGSLRNY